MPTLIDKEVQLLARIRNGDDRAIDEVYRLSKGQFMSFARKLLKDENSQEDIFQDTVIAFYENVRTGKIVALKSSITTYIIGIGKHMLYRHLKKMKPMRPLDEIDEGTLGIVTNTYMEQLVERETSRALQQAIHYQDLSDWGMLMTLRMKERLLTLLFGYTKSLVLDGKISIPCASMQ